MSQLQKFTPEVGGCPSRWYFRYVLGLPDDPPSKGQARGSEGHKRVEDWLRSGVNVLDRLERRGLPFMPVPNMIDGKPTAEALELGPVLVEEHFKAPADIEPDDGKQVRAARNVPLMALDVPVIGYIDLVNPRQLARTGVVQIKDWKFKKSIELYAAKPADLLNPKNEAGIQMLGYARWAFDAFPGVKTVELSHVTFQTQGMPDVKESGPVPIHVDSAKALWETVTHVAIPGMQKAAAAEHFSQVPRNERVCYKYKKACPYLSTCQDRMARIRAGFRAKAHVTVPTAPTAPQTAEETMGLLKTMTGQQSQPIHSESVPDTGPAVPAPKRALPPIVDPPGAKLQAQHAQAGKDYEIAGVKYRFLTFMTLGDKKYASFTPIAGGPPQMVELTTEIAALAPPQVTPPDVPKSDPALAAQPLPSTPAGAVSPPAIGVLVSACVLGDKYEVNGQIGEFTGTSNAGGGLGFFQTTAGAVKLPLTAFVKMLPGAASVGPAAVAVPSAQPTAGPSSPPAPAAPSVAPVEQPTGQAAASAAGNPLPQADEPKKRGRPRKETAQNPVGATAAGSAAAGGNPVQSATAGTGAQAPAATEVHKPTTTPDGTPYGSMQGVRLYFGCSPVGVVADTLGPYVNRLEQELMKAGQLNVADLRIASDQVFGFNKWKGFLTKMAQEMPPPAGHYVMVGYADERVSCVADALAQIAEPGAVVIGGR